MESTGSYWKPIFNMLEPSLSVVLANPQQVKNVKNLPGHKTDRRDGKRLAHLLWHGLIQASFIPPKPIRELRGLTRRRRQLLGAGGSERNRMQKILEDANVKLDSVLTDLFGVSGQAMLEELLEGSGSPESIAEFARGRLKRKVPDIIAALEGHQMSDHHRFLIRQALRHMEFLEREVEELGREVLRKLEPYSEQFHRLQTIPGIKEGGDRQHSGRNRRQYEDLPQRWPPVVLGRCLPGQQRKRRQTQEWPHTEGERLASLDTDRGGIGSIQQERFVLQGKVLSARRPAGEQARSLCRRPFAPHHGLAGARLRSVLSGGRRRLPR